MISIGLDIGTTTICGVVFDTEQGRQLAAETRDNDTWEKAEDWARIQDPDAIFDKVFSILREFQETHGTPGAIGVTGQMHGIVYVDSEGNAVSPLYTWQDPRGGMKTPEGDNFCDRIESMTGYKLSPGFGIATHAWNLHHQVVPQNAVRLCTVHDYCAMKLAGEKQPVTDPTDAASLGLFDLQKLCFDLPAFDRLGMDASILPKVVPSGAPIGHTPEGTPVFSAIGDNQASVLGSVSDISGTILLNMGTGGQISAFSGEYVSVPGLDTRPFPGGGYILVGASVSGGKSYALLEGFFRSVLDFAGVDFQGRLYDAMGAIDPKRLVSPQTPRVCTLFSGSRLQPDQKGSITGLTPDNLTADNLVAGFINGMVAELHDYYSKMPASVHENTSRLAGSGGGLRKVPLLRKRFEQVFNMPLSVPTSHEEASLGVALLAATSAGAYPNLQEAGKAIQYDTPKDD